MISNKCQYHSNGSTPGCWRVIVKLYIISVTFWSHCIIFTNLICKNWNRWIVKEYTPILKLRAFKSAQFIMSSTRFIVLCMLMTLKILIVKLKWIHTVRSPTQSEVKEKSPSSLNTWFRKEQNWIGVDGSMQEDVNELAGDRYRNTCIFHL